MMQDEQVDSFFDGYPSDPSDNAEEENDAAADDPQQQPANTTGVSFFDDYPSDPSDNEEEENDAAAADPQPQPANTTKAPLQQDERMPQEEEEGTITVSTTQVESLLDRSKELENKLKALAMEKLGLEEEKNELAIQNEMHQDTIASMQQQLERANALDKLQLEETNQEVAMQNEFLFASIASLKQELVELRPKLQQQQQMDTVDLSWGMDEPEQQKQQQQNPNSNNNNEQAVAELHKTIDELKQKVMGLVEEKLQLQETVDSLEHQFVEVDLDGENKKEEKKKRDSKLGSFFSPTSKKGAVKMKELPPPIVVDENTNQGDILKQTLARKKEKQWGHRISGVFSSGEEGDGKIDVDLLRRLSEEIDDESKTTTEDNITLTKKEEEELTASRQSWSSLSQGNVTRSMLDGMSAGFGTDSAYQAKFLSSVIDKNQKPTTTWSRFSGYVYGSTGEEDPQIDFQKLKRLAESAGTGKARDEEVIRSLSEPDSMLEEPAHPKPAAVVMTTSRPPARGLDPLMISNYMLQAEEEEVVFNNQHIAPAAVFKPAPHNPNKPPRMVGAGKEIDQSNLLGIYVKKQEEKSGTTFTYLTNMIYGDDEEEVKQQEDMLRKQLVKKKREDQRKQREMEELERQQAAALLAPAKPRTMLSGNI